MKKHRSNQLVVFVITLFSYAFVVLCLLESDIISLATSC